jgi:sphingosine kinase
VSAPHYRRRLLPTHCKLIDTERSLHAYDVAFKTPLDFDVVVTLSGDGLIFEIFNGFGNRPERAEALAIPICPIPAGSANGLCVSLLGIKVRSLLHNVAMLISLTGRLRCV